MPGRARTVTPGLVLGTEEGVTRRIALFQAYTNTPSLARVGIPRVVFLSYFLLFVLKERLTVDVMSYWE